MPERGENISDMDKLVNTLLGVFCKTGNLQLGQITDAPSSSNKNENPIEVAKQEKAKKDTVDKERKERERKFKEKEENERKEREKKENCSCS